MREASKSELLLLRSPRFQRVLMAAKYLAASVNHKLSLLVIEKVIVYFAVI